MQSLIRVPVAVKCLPKDALLSEYIPGDHR
jgi:hypothetical protein